MPCTPSSKLHTPCRLHALMNEGKDQVPEEHQGMDSETFHPQEGRCAFLVSYGRVGVVVIDILCILSGRGSGCGPWLIGRQTVWFMMVGTVWLLAISRAHHLLRRIWKCRKFWGEFNAATTTINKQQTPTLFFQAGQNDFRSSLKGIFFWVCLSPTFFGQIHELNTFRLQVVVFENWLGSPVW